jgi:phage-related protein
MQNFEVEYYLEDDGASPVSEFLDQLPPKAAAKCVKYIGLLADQGFNLSRNYSAHLEGDVWELRPEFGNVEYRLLYGHIKGRFFVVAHAIKKGWKVPQRDIDLAAERVRKARQRYEEQSGAQP